ncbi:MAG: hypothetical protein ABIJ96_12180 [Elusimicrobiota bacterium]
MASDWIDRLERRFEDWHLPQLALFIVGMNAAVYILCVIRPEFRRMLELDPALILRGEVWRTLTFLFIPPMVSPLWMLFWLYLLFIYAQALEREWGDFRFNLYYGIGAAATIAASLLLRVGLSNMTLNTGIFLAFAALYPDFELLLFFILPVKVKWLAYFAWGGIVLSFLGGSWITRIALIAGLINYALFFGRRHWEDVQFWLQVRRNRRRHDKAGKKDDDDSPPT